MKKKCWHDKAKDLFYNDKLTIVDIEKEIGVTQKTISAFLQMENPEAYKLERKRRKDKTKEKTKQIKEEYRKNNPEKVRQSQIKYQAKQLDITPEEYEVYLFQRPTLKDELRQQHEDDVIAMSSHGLSKSISNRELSYYRSAYRQTKSGNFRRLDVTKDGAVVPKLGLPKSIKFY